MKSLQELISEIQSTPELFTVYAKQPWSPDSNAGLKADPEDPTNPFEKDGLTYFLEVFIIQEMVSKMGGYSLKEKSDAVIKYAKNDA